MTSRCSSMMISHFLFVFLSKWKHLMSFLEIRQSCHLCAPRRLYEDVSEDEQPAAASSSDDEDDVPVISQKEKQQLPKPPNPLSLFPRREDDRSEGPSSSRSSLQSRPTTPNTPATPSLLDARQSRIQEARDARIFVLLENQQEQLREQTRLLRLILARGLVQNAVPSELPEGISFPLKTVEDLTALEEQMSQANAATSVVKYLAEYGGSDIVDTVSRIMKTVMTTNLARQYNLTGTKQKMKLDGLHFINIIFRCLQLNPSTRSCSRKEMEGAIQKWLTGSRDREGGRKNRARVNPMLPE